MATLLGIIACSTLQEKYFHWNSNFAYIAHGKFAELKFCLSLHFYKPSIKEIQNSLVLKSVNLAIMIKGAKLSSGYTHAFQSCRVDHRLCKW